MGSLQESLEWRKPSRDIDRERKGFAESEEEAEEEEGGRNPRGL